MSWNLQSLNQHSNPAVYPFEHTNFPAGPPSYTSNPTMPYPATNNHSNTQITQINRINEYNNNNAFGGNSMRHTNHQQSTTIHYANSKRIPQFTNSQFQNIELPPLPKELQLKPFQIPSNPNRNSTIQPRHPNHTHSRNYNGTILNNTPMPFTSNLYRSHSLNSIPHSNGIHPNGHTINIKRVNNVNMNQNGRNANYMMNNNQVIEQLMVQHTQRNTIHRSNGNALQRSQSFATPKSFTRTPKPIATPQSYQALQQMQNALHRGRIMQNKPKKITQNRIKLRFKRPRFNVNKQMGNGSKPNLINRMNTAHLPPPITIATKPRTNINATPPTNAMNPTNVNHAHKPPLHTANTVPIPSTTPITVPIPPTEDTVASTNSTSSSHHPKMDAPIAKLSDSEETKTKTKEDTEDTQYTDDNVHIDKTALTTLDEEGLVDVNGVKWDDTVNWVCGVCEGADAQTDNALVVCEGCCRAVHQHCYGITPKQMASDKDWYCHCCQYKLYILDNHTLLDQLRNIYAQYTHETGGTLNSHNHTWTVSKLREYKHNSLRSQNGFVMNACENTRSRRMIRKATNPMDAAHRDPTPSDNPFDDVIIPLNVLTDAETTAQTFFSGKTLPRCSLCCTLGGAYKLSVDRKWVHMSCCIYHPNVYFSSAAYSNDPVLSEITMESAKAMCNACRSTIGACVQCTAKDDTNKEHKCDQWFHVTCMQQKSLYLFYSPQESLTAYCKEHTEIFKEKQTQQHTKSRRRTRLSGRKRNRHEADGEYTPKAPTRGRPKGSRNRSRSTKRKRKNKPTSKGKTPTKETLRRAFSPEPSEGEIEYINHRVQQYMDALLREDENAEHNNNNNNNNNAHKSDDISSISSQEIDERRKPLIREPPKKKRKKSAVDLLSHSSFALKRNKWIFNQTFHLYPNREEFYESKDSEIANGYETNPNHWTLETTTDPTQMVAEQCMRSVETLWTHRQTNLLAKSQNSRDYRKAIGFSILRNPARDVITSCNWSFWEVSATKKAVLIKLFITEPYSKSRIPQRRKKNGTLLAAHVMDISFRLRDDVDWVVICSERGIAEIFWRALGFVDFSSQEKRAFCRGTEKDLNQFRDTILLRMHHSDYVKRYCNNTRDWEDDNCAVQKIFRKWRKKHLFMTRRVVFKHKGNSVHTTKLSSY